MGSRINVAVGGANGYAKRMADLRDRRIVDFIVSNEAGKNRQAGGVRRSPAVGPAIIAVHIEKRAGPGEPLAQARAVKYVVKLIKIVALAVDDQQMAILAAAPIDVARIAALDPARLSDRLGRDRIKRKTRAGAQIHAVALIPILKLNTLQIRAGDAAYHRVRHAVNAIRCARVVAAEVGMKPARAAVVDERNKIGGIPIHRPTADVAIPP